MVSRTMSVSLYLRYGRHLAFAKLPSDATGSIAVFESRLRSASLLALQGRTNVAPIAVVRYGGHLAASPPWPATLKGIS